MLIFIPRAREARVAATPETVALLRKAGHAVRVERDAGTRAHFDDAAYRDAGAERVDEPERSYAEADALFVVSPRAEALGSLSEGALVIGLLAPWRNLEAVRTLRDRRARALAMELVPRTTRAQPMDALSSQASIAGYKAALLVASHLDKQLPLMMTAAGTLHPARVVILGAGVAGLSALATCRRLGATVEVSDVREEAKEQVESLGGRFIELPMRESGAGEGGYAREMTPDFLAEQRAVVADRIALADAVITTALVPGKPAPRLVDAATVERMRPGAVIVDLAVEAGGNCELSEADETVVRHGVTLLGPANLPATVPMDASTVYARNVHALFAHAVDEDGALALDDEVVRGALLTLDGEVRHAPTRAALEGGAS